MGVWVFAASNVYLWMIGNVGYVSFNHLKENDIRKQIFDQGS